MDRGLRRIALGPGEATVRRYASGSYQASSTAQLPLVEHWNGRTWSRQSAPTQPGADTNSLQGISCTSATSCLAVGFWSPSSAATGINVLLDRYNGTRWTRLSAPGTGQSLSALGSISCIGPSICSAVGSEGLNGGYKVLAERWDGTSWAVRTAGNVGAGSGLSSVACVLGVCRGVGVSLPSQTNRPTLPWPKATE